MRAAPDTLRLVQVVHDTVRVLVRDTVVRVVEPQAADRWVIGLTKQSDPS